MARKGGNLGTAVLELDVDESKLSSGLAEGEKKAMGFMQRVTTGIKNLGSSMKGGIAQGLGLAGGLGAVQAIAGAAQAVTSYIGDAVQMASDLNEEMTKSDVVFGKRARSVQDFAKGAAAIGLSTQAALGAAGAFGNMFNTIGLAQDASAGMSIKMVQLASDMASFNNEDPSEMLDKLRSGLAGEAEPLRRFGVLLSEAAVKTFAYANGIAASGSELTEAQKVQARYGLILEQTSIQQGDFARTADGMANQTRQNDAAMANLQTRIGKGLLPVWEALGWVLGHVVLPVLNTIVDGLGKVGDAIGAVGDAVTDMALNFGEQGDRLHRTADRMGLDFQAVKDRVKHYMLDMGLSFKDAADKAERDFELMKTSAGRAQLALEQMPPRMQRMMKLFSGAVAKGTDDVVADVDALVPEMADALLANQFELTDAVDQLVEFMKKALSPAEQAFQAQAFLSSQAYKDGMNSGIPSVVKKTEELRDKAIAAISATGGAWAGGAAIINAWVGSMEYTMAQRLAHYLLMVKRYGDVLGGSLPTAGPLQHPERGGKSIAEAWLGGMQDALGPLRLPALPGLPVLPGLTALGNMATDSRGLGGAGGGTTFNEYHWHLSVGGVDYDFRNRDDFINALDDLSAFGDGRLA